MIAVKKVSKSYGSVKILNDLSVTIQPDEFLSIHGESGSGKTTLLHLLARIGDPSSGSIEVDGANIRTLPLPVLQLYRSRIGVMFQDPPLMAHLNVAENIALPLDLLGAPAALIRRNSADLIKRLGLASIVDAFPSSLSRAEKSLVGIARALITAPVIILADEPLDFLDQEKREIVIGLLKTMHKQGTTVVFFTRDAELAQSMPGKHAHLKDGKIVARIKEEKAEKMTAKDSHRILEEEQPVTQKAPIEADDVEPGADKGGGKKIRITSIGSNL